MPSVKSLVVPVPFKYKLVPSVKPVVVWLLISLTVPVTVAVIVPAAKLPEASRFTIVDAVFASVALEVTVNVPDSVLTEPLIPLPVVVACST